MFRLKDECSSSGHILEQVKYRSEWIKYQEAQKRREEEELEKERGEEQSFCLALKNVCYTLSCSGLMCCSLLYLFSGICPN